MPSGAHPLTVMGNCFIVDRLIFLLLFDSSSYLCAACQKSLFVREVFRQALTLYFFHAVIILVIIEKISDSVNYKRLRYSEYFLIRLGDFNTKKIIYDSLVSQYKVLVSIFN